MDTAARLGRDASPYHKAIGFRTWVGRTLRVSRGDEVVIRAAQDAIMAATVLNSPQAVQMSVAVVRAFVKLRRMALSVESLARKIAAMENKYDAQFRDVFQAILQLMTPPDPPRRKIGFDADR